MKKTTRQIVVDGKRYLWRFYPRYRPRDSVYKTECLDVFSAWLEGHPRAPLRLVCVTWDDVRIGGPLRSAAPLEFGVEDSPQMNLHEPRWAAAIIRHAVQTGWTPESLPKPFTVTEWLGFLKAVWAAEKASPTG